MPCISEQEHQHKHCLCALPVHSFVPLDITQLYREISLVSSLTSCAASQPCPPWPSIVIGDVPSWQPRLLNSVRHCVAPPAPTFVLCRCHGNLCHHPPPAPTLWPASTTHSCNRLLDDSLCHCPMLHVYYSLRSILYNGISNLSMEAACGKLKVSLLVPSSSYQNREENYTGSDSFVNP
jgi:hypothetical protein